MRALLLSVAAWSLAAAGILLLWPGSVPLGGCWRLVQPPPGCLDQLAELNRRIWLSQTLPMLAVIGSGYILIGAWGIRSMRRWRRSQARE